MGLEVAHGVNLRLHVLQFLCDFVRLLQIFQIALHELDSARVPVFFQRLHRFGCVFLFLRDEDDFRCIVLQNVGCDSESYTCGTTSDDVDLE